MDTTVSASNTVTREQEYSVMAVDPNLAIPNVTVIRGTRTQQETSEETLTRPADHPEPTLNAIQRYENMEDDLPSLSSVSTPSTPSAKVSSGAERSSSSSGNNPVANIINNMDFPPGVPTDNVAHGIAQKAQFKVTLQCSVVFLKIVNHLSWSCFQKPTNTKSQQETLLRENGMKKTNPKDKEQKKAKSNHKADKKKP